MYSHGLVLMREKEGLLLADSWPVEITLWSPVETIYWVLSYSASDMQLLTLISCGLFLLIYFYVTRIQKCSKYKIK